MAEFVGVKCCDCCTFQVMQKRKDNKWACKICSKKQSTIKIYARSHKAKDVREVIQKLNMSRGEKREEIICEEKQETNIPKWLQGVRESKESNPDWNLFEIKEGEGVIGLDYRFRDESDQECTLDIENLRKTNKRKLSHKKERDFHKKTHKFVRGGGVEESMEGKVRTLDSTDTKGNCSVNKDWTHCTIENISQNFVPSESSHTNKNWLNLLRGDRVMSIVEQSQGSKKKTESRPNLLPKINCEETDSDRSKNKTLISASDTFAQLLSSAHNKTELCDVEEPSLSKNVQENENSVWSDWV